MKSSARFWHALFFSVFIFATTILPATAENRFLPEIEQGVLVEHKYYTLSYSEKHEQAEWVYYKIQQGEAERTDDFRSDDKIETGSATLSDYRGSGYDRGHLAPAASLSFNEESMSESFLLSNMTPQKPAFNRGKWRELEMQVRKWSNFDDSLHVISAPILTDDLKQIGESGVSIPNAYYKIIYSENSDKMIAFLMPNEDLDKSLQAYVVTVDIIEQKTGIDFFREFDDINEQKLESVISFEAWRFDDDSFVKKVPTKEPLEESIQCLGITKKLTRCKNRTKNGSGYCHLHSDVTLAN